jgi:hypothetical protein
LSALPGICRGIEPAYRPLGFARGRPDLSRLGVAGGAADTVYGAVGE